MAKCFNNKSGTHNDASDCIIEKLILDPLLIGTNCREKHADLIDEFEGEYGEFTNRQGGFAKDNIWLVAAKPDTEGYHWHVKYSIETAVVLGKLVRIGNVNDSWNCHGREDWKHMKKVKKEDRGKTELTKLTNKS